MSTNRLNFPTVREYEQSMRKFGGKMAERYYILIHHGGEITNIEEGTTFCSKNPIYVTIRAFVTLLKLQNKTLHKLG